jgi:ubiquinone/menaquinone biosynthesis C-methylase UbiE
LSTYDAISTCYDVFTEDVDYKKRAENILTLFEKYDRKPTLILDLACGTGNFSFQFAKEGIETIGVDPSEGMLSAAIKKLAPGATNPLFLNQRAEDLELFGTVDGAVCLLDSLNHITEKSNLVKAFSKVSLFLEKDRLFIFDINTPYKHKNVLGNNTFVKENENAFCVWQNECEDGKTVNIYMDIFLENADGGYERLSEDFSEVAYSEEEIDEILLNTGFEKVAVLDAELNGEITKTTERILYIVRKK